MKKILLLSFIFIAFGSLRAQPTDCRATCRSSGLTIKAFIKPFTQNVVFTSSTSVQLIIVFSLPAGGATNTSTAPVPVSITSPLGTPVFLTPPGGVWLNVPDDRFDYAYVVTTNSPPAATWLANQEYLAMSLTFGPTALGKLPRLDHLLPSGGGPGGAFIFYLEVASLVRSDSEVDPYYTLNGTEGFYGNGDQYVQPLLPLPVKLISFSAEKNGEKSAMLNWSSASESNSSYFGIERSLDKINWKSIGQVKAAGNSQIVLNYQYLDNNVYNGVSSSLTVYYRLKMTDLDGSFDYSPIESVTFGKPRDITDNASGFLVYPNPASEGIHVEWDADQVKQPTSLEFYDLSGKLVYTEKVEEQTNQHYVDFTRTNIQTGLVLMRVLSGDEAIEYKQIVVGQNH